MAYLVGTVTITCLDSMLSLCIINNLLIIITTTNTLIMANIANPHSVTKTVLFPCRLSYCECT